MPFTTCCPGGSQGQAIFVEDEDRQMFLDTLGEMAQRFEVEIWEQSPPRHSTDANPFRGNRYKASYQVFTLLLDQFDQILGNPMTF